MTGIDEDCERLGLSGAEVLELRRTEPWVNSWASRHGDGEKHLREWLPHRSRPDHSALEIEGVEAIVAAFREALGLMPDAAADHIVRHVRVLCGDAARDVVPAGALGVCGPSATDAGTDRPLTIGLLVDSIETAAHEGAHAWGADLAAPRWTRALHAEIAECGRQVIAAEGSAAERVERVMRGEYAADRLASIWIGRTVDTTTGIRGERRRRALYAQIERARQAA